ncbi:peptidylprolyl isomerase [Chachezhania antarctica]|uniref:peptidylprolyl isomerase n=1 Tax=Chachezhania antarctica TaxID=2340860 RepID=UPI000EAC095C|nr:peptidylprolyl isomerase [Chachezhania antarctica]|tara:strand:- start:5113 stop:6354 length:1242 start_codon:yes stop_codon:yes gene_type:complete
MFLILTPARRTGAYAFLIAAVFALFGATSAMANGLFLPAVIVNDDVITNYEIQQRSRLLALLRAPGSSEKEARESLLEDRLRQQAMRQYGLTLAEADVTQGIDDFAQRANLSGEELLNALEENGVARETMRDYVTVNLGWTELVRGLFLETARPSMAEIDRALGLAGTTGGVRVLLSEIIIPITAQTAEEVDALAGQLAEIDSVGEFSAAAQRYSAAQTAQDGGRMPWIDLNRLPPQLRPIILSLSPGQVSDPLGLEGAVALFQMRDIQEIAAQSPSYSAIEFATLALPGGRTADTLARAQAIKARVSECTDLYGEALGMPEEALQIRSMAPSEIPQDISIELAQLDDGESSYELTRNNGQTLLFVMLCSRTAEANKDATREQVAQALTVQRLEAASRGFIDQLKADAIIVYK